jgi:hypothetical protein
VNSDTSKPTLKAERLASGGSVVSRPDYDYPFDREADKAAFRERGKREKAETDSRNTQLIHKRLVKARETRKKNIAEKFERERIEARALFAEGHTYAEIALKMGTTKCRAHELVDEDYHQLVKARKARYEAKRRQAA